MKNSFIIGIVWTAVIIGVISFGATVFFLDNNNVAGQNIGASESNGEKEQQSAYITDETSIRTNNLANLNDNEIAEIGLTQINNITSNSSKKDIKNNKDNSDKIDDEMLNNMDEWLANEDEILETTSSNVNSFIRPVKGDVLNPLSVDELVYSKTLQEWNIHVGTDYKAQLGDEVYAIRNGKITEINFNQKYGDYIVIEHDDGYESLYANITVLDALKVGDNLKQGQTIGYVAESFGFEVAEVTHLHFELRKNGEYISIY